MTISETHSDYNGFGFSSCGDAPNDGFINIEVIGGTGVYTYEWTSNNGFSSNQEDIDGLDGGIYTVVATDQNGCSISIEVDINEADDLQIDIVLTEYNGGYNVSCYGENDGQMYVIPSGGTGIYTYNWFDGVNENQIMYVDGVLVIDNLSAGVYPITVTDTNNCSEFIEVEVVEPDPIEISVEYSDYTGYGVSCNGATDGWINVTVTGGTGVYTYDWSNGETTQDLSDISAGIYVLTVVDDNFQYNDCFASVQVDIIEPTEDTDLDGIADFCDICPLDPFNDTMYPNGICDNEDILGCTDPQACNYNIEATYNYDINQDGFTEINEGCVYLPEPIDCIDCSGDPAECYECSGEQDGTGEVLLIDTDEDGIGDCWEIPGCMDELACNYNSTSNEDDGSCIYSSDLDECATCSGETDGTGIIVDNDADDDGICDIDDDCPLDPFNDTMYPNGICDNEDILGQINLLIQNVVILI